MLTLSLQFLSLFMHMLCLCYPERCEKMHHRNTPHSFGNEMPWASNPIARKISLDEVDPLLPKPNIGLAAIVSGKCSVPFKVPFWFKDIRIVVSFSGHVPEEAAKLQSPRLASKLMQIIC
ncbi:uncharacterized protein EDB93DRAFT_477219 [Suillus bovinus]|uniref:uncharacterized protein n=1 Tax=Suillus bovinus TaxID=48563 RepID=UPI001B868F3E|nr:uncharacterized protein EDB93DRAFT_477219 [Suillus bovinus]KAG2146473.1 hypothetical protein EDB93DRAFT_477219 [Suillus bovinus]